MFQESAAATSELVGASALFASLAALGAAAGWGVGTTLFERALRGDGSERPPGAAAANLFKNTLAVVTFSAAALLLGSVWPQAGAWRPLVGGGLLGFAIGDTATFAALPRCGVQVTTLCGNLIPPIAALLGFAFLGERLALTTLVAMGVCIAGIALVILDRSAPSPPAHTRRAGLAFAFVAALSQGIAIVAGRSGFDGVELLPGTVARLCGGLGGALVLTLVQAGFVRGASSARPLTELFRPWFHPRLGLRLIPAAFFAAILVLPFHSIGLRGLPSGVSAALFATTPLFTLPIGRLFFGARFGWRSVVGTLIGFAGTVGTIWSTNANQLPS